MIFIPCTHSVSTGGNGEFEKWVQLRHFCTYRPEILHIPRGRQYAQSCHTEFWISSPKKFGAPLNFAFALRLMGWKISNRHFEVDFKNIESIFSQVLGRRCTSLTWLFREWEIFLTRFSSIFVCFTPPLIFPEPLKLACWNFHRRCIGDGAN